MSKNHSHPFKAFARVLLTFGMALFVLAGALDLHSVEAKPRTHTVTIRGMNYLPPTLTVDVGDTVVWKNEDMVPHTVTDRGKSFESRSIVSGASWSYVANKKGTYSYYCTFHPNMNGKLIVR
jgi:plastocyanin